MIDVDTVELQPRYDVVVDAHGREGIGLLEDHPDLAAGIGDAHTGGVDVLTVQQDLTRDPCTDDQLMHPVERAQEGRLAASRGTDERHDLSGRHEQGHPVQDEVGAEPAGDVDGLK